MKARDIYTGINTKIFVVTNQDDEDEMNWTIEPTELELLPDEENLYYVKAFQILNGITVDCYLGITTPERIAETVILRISEGQTVAKNIYEIEQIIIPAVASECLGDYELYYSKEVPQLGISILKDGLDKANNKNVVAEDLGYILRDEGRKEEAIEAFRISVDNQPSSEYIYLELSRLYEELGHATEQQKYEQKFKENGGIE